MRQPDFELDGWSLVDAEDRHREAPDSFCIPELSRREALQCGDLVKLIFRISVSNDDDPVSVERMWVVVRGRVGGQYVGILDNDPFAIEENEDFWSGTELPFEARHIVDIAPADKESLAKAKREPRRSWPRDPN